MAGKQLFANQSGRTCRTWSHVLVRLRKLDTCLAADHGGITRWAFPPVPAAHSTTAVSGWHQVGCRGPIPDTVALCLPDQVEARRDQQPAAGALGNRGVPRQSPQAHHRPREAADQEPRQPMAHGVEEEQ